MQRKADGDPAGPAGSAVHRPSDSGCAISIESYNEWRDWTVKYDPSTLGTVGGFAALIGIPLLLIGLIVFVIGVVTDRRRAKASPVAGP